jgi:hypothetical protein
VRPWWKKKRTWVLGILAVIVIIIIANAQGFRKHGKHGAGKRWMQVAVCPSWTNATDGINETLWLQLFEHQVVGIRFFTNHESRRCFENRKKWLKIWLGSICNSCG